MTSLDQPRPAHPDTLRLVELLSRVETGVALHDPADPPPHEAIAAVARAAELLLSPVNDVFIGGRPVGQPDSAVFAPLFRDWEGALLNALRSMGRFYDLLDTEGKADYWCAVSGVPQPATRRLELPEDAQDHTARRDLRLALADYATSADHDERVRAASLEAAFAPLYDPTAPLPTGLEGVAAACLKAQRARLDRAVTENDALRSRLLGLPAVGGVVAPSPPSSPHHPSPFTTLRSPKPDPKRAKSARRTDDAPAAPARRKALSAMR